MTLKKNEKKTCHLCHEKQAVVVETTEWMTDHKANTKHYFCAGCKIMEMKKRGYL
jgi:hypothetical protein